MKERYSSKRGLRAGLIGAIVLTSAITGGVDFYNYGSRQQAYIDSIVPPINPEQLEYSRVNYERLHRLVDLSLLLANPVGDNSNRQVYFVVTPELKDAVNIVYQDRNRQEEKHKFSMDPVNLTRNFADVMAMFALVTQVTSSLLLRSSEKHSIVPVDKDDLDGL